jgi:dihydrofolate reductase
MLSIIAAVSSNNVIGVNNQLPWNLPTDLKRFAKITHGKNIVMGARTYDSIISRNKKPLLNREHYVLSSNSLKIEYSNVNVYSSWDLLYRALPALEENFIIGGAMLYKLTLPFCNKLYITRVHAKVTGDTFFPEINKNDWKEEMSEFIAKDSFNEFDSTFFIYSRVYKN